MNHLWEVNQRQKMNQNTQETQFDKMNQIL
jgi:hypothetical protein